MSCTRIPLITLSLVGVALLMEVSPVIAGTCSFDRAWILEGEIWRILTGHFVHGLPRLALFDLLGLGIVGAWVEARGRRLYLRALLASALASALALLAFTGFEHYLGCSALVSGLWAVALVLAWQEGRHELSLAAVVILVVKVALEAAGFGPGLDLPPGHEVSAVAHGSGALAGACVTLSRGLFSERGRPAGPNSWPAPGKAGAFSER